jgi:hypothetical protein
MTFDTLDTLLLGKIDQEQAQHLISKAGKVPGSRPAQHKLSQALGRAAVEASRRQLLEALGVMLPNGLGDLERMSIEKLLVEAQKEASGEEDQEGEDAGDDEGETGTFHTSTRPEGNSPSIEQVKRTQQGVTTNVKKSAPFLKGAEHYLAHRVNKALVRKSNEYTALTPALAWTLRLDYDRMIQAASEGGILCDDGQGNSYLIRDEHLGKLKALAS